MKKLTKLNLFIFAIISLAIIQSCKDKTKDETPNENLNADILKDYSTYICLNNYELLAQESATLYSTIQTLVANASQQNLKDAQQQWLKTRMVWEKSEAHLFGPVATNNIDPRIDTWPVDFIRLDSVMSSNATLNETYVNNLEESLKGFHPIEYLLFGLNSNKQASDLTLRQKEYLEALGLNLKNLTASLASDWNNGFYNEFSKTGNTTYPTQKAAFEEMVNAMVGICDEVANGKIDEVFTTLDSTKEESPFANNSIKDFTYNIIGVQESYLVKNNIADGKGLEDFVRKYNLSLDGSIKQKTNAAIGALNNITVPFGQAIYTQPLQVQAAVDAINALKDELENNLLPLVQLHTK